ncbi:preprotein translocase subunit SecG [Luteolibacter pohnpeiensis]|uniref:Protein-export membrane protein SecG n=1 Tax=Luteolibacter pohnpeiensis TaxID=454153 RepID=A0A934VWB5_9BACT|nr:preprotein translocase subunit SecG [Luteolibacter pohnpeiensis]MBK1883115.1 preprotein translocase subunit SecG [Luteolibacter pohnpeiensis]
MTLAAIPWLDLSITALLIVFVLICALMTLVILMQRPKQEGLGAAFGSGVTDQVFGARTTNVLQRSTAYFGIAFFVLSLILANLIGLKNKQVSLLQPKKTAEATAAPAEPAKPKSLTEDLPPVTPVAPVAPSTPAVPESTVPPTEPVEQPAPENVPPDVSEPAPADENAPAVEPAPTETEETPANPGEKTEGQ